MQAQSSSSSSLISISLVFGFDFLFSFFLSKEIFLCPSPNISQRKQPMICSVSRVNLTSPPCEEKEEEWERGGEREAFGPQKRAFKIRVQKNGKEFSVPRNFRNSLLCVHFSHLLRQMNSVA